MPEVWQKRYGFRLRDSDRELKALLDQIPSAKKSEAIRQLLHFAYRTLTERKEEEKQFQTLYEEIEALKKAQAQQFQELRVLLLQIRQPNRQETIKVDDEDGSRVADDAVKLSAEALLSFGQQD